MPFPPTLTAFTNAAPCPRVEVRFNTLAATTATVTVFRIVEGREFRVRSAVNAAAAGTFTRLDFECPFGVPATYRAEMFTAAGVSLGFTDSVSVTLNVVDAWMHNPLNPAAALLVDLDYNSARSIARPTPGDILYPEGRSVGVVITKQRRGIVGVDLMVTTDTAAEAAAVDDMLGGYDTRVVPVLCLRTPPFIRLPRTFFAVILEPVQRPINIHAGGQLTEWDLPATEVSPPAPSLIIPLLTRDDISAFFATRTAVNVAHLTRDAVSRRYDLAGTT